MASSWTRSLGIGDYGSQMRVTVTVEAQNLAANRSSVHVKIEAYNGGISRTYNTGSGAAVSVTGNGVSWSGRETFSIPARSWFTFHDASYVIYHAADGTLDLNLVGRISDTGTSALGDGGGVRIQGTADPLYLAPTAPAWGATTFQTTTSVKASWTSKATARGAYDNVRVQRWARSTGKWYHRALLPGSATSYTDTDLSPNDEHKWRVRAEGPGGNSGWVEGGTLGTTPAAATNVRAVKAEQGIDVSWTDNAAGTNRPRTFYIDDNPGGTGWVRVGEIGGSATSWSHADADPAVTHQYRVWVRITSQIELTGAVSDPSNTVQLQAPPDQPQRQAPADGSVQTIGVPFTLEWEHRPVDTTAQTAAEVQWRLDGGTWTTVTVTGAEQALEVNPTLPGARAQFEWRVRTRGAHPDWSPYSTINGPRISTPPIIAIQAPTNGEALATSRVTASWTYEPGGTETQLAQAEWKASLFLGDTGTLIEQRSGTTAEEVALGTRLENGIEYVLTVAVRNGDGLWSGGESAQFSTNFPVPAEVMAIPSWDHDTAAVSVGFRDSEQLRATHRWTGEPGVSTSEAVVDDGLPNLVDPEVSAAQWGGSSGAIMVEEPRGETFPWLPDSITTMTRVDYSGSGSRYISLASNARPAAVPGKWYGLAVSQQTPDGVNGSLNLQFTSGGTRATVNRPLPPEGGILEVVGQAQEGDGSVWPVIWPGLSTEPFYTTGAILVEADTEEQAWEALRRGFTPEVAERNLAPVPRFSSDTSDVSYSAIYDRGVAEVDGEQVTEFTVTRDPNEYAYVGQYVPPENLVPERWIAAKFWVRTRTPGTMAQARARVNYTGPQLYGDMVQLRDDEWVTVTVAGEITSGSTKALLAVYPYTDAGEAVPVGSSLLVQKMRMVVERTQQEALDAVNGPYFDGDTPGVTDVDAIDVERREPDGTWTLIASAIDTSSTITDRTPHIGDVEYRAISRTILPTETEGPAATAEWVHGRDPVYVNGGDGMGQQCLARGAEASDEHAVDQALHRFAGQERPVAFFGTGQEHRTSFNGKILPHYHLPVSSRAEWVALLRERGLVCFRDCTGRKVFGVLTASFGQSGNVQTISLEVEEAQYVEGVTRVSDLELEARQEASA